MNSGVHVVMIYWVSCVLLRLHLNLFLLVLIIYYLFSLELSIPIFGILA